MVIVKHANKELWSVSERKDGVDIFREFRHGYNQTRYGPRHWFTSRTEAEGAMMIERAMERWDGAQADIKKAESLLGLEPGGRSMSDWMC